MNTDRKQGTIVLSITFPWEKGQDRGIWAMMLFPESAGNALFYTDVATVFLFSNVTPGNLQWLPQKEYDILISVESPDVAWRGPGRNGFGGFLRTEPEEHS